MPEGQSGSADLQALEQQVRQGRNFENPPLHRWDPPLSGDIDILIRADGSWWHEGAPIERESIVRLFAAILRREQDGHYYLVTPGEKWRIQVESHPLLVTGLDREGEDWLATLNTGRQYRIDAGHPLFLDQQQEGVAAVSLPHGLSALCSRAAWYRLVQNAEEIDGVPAIRSGGQDWPLL